MCNSGATDWIVASCPISEAASWASRCRFAKGGENVHFVRLRRIWFGNAPARRFIRPKPCFDTIERLYFCLAKSFAIAAMTLTIETPAPTAPFESPK
jgi:hypothetical protein